MNASTARYAEGDGALPFRRSDDSLKWRPVAFTLVEMLVVMAVIVVIIALAKPTFNALAGAGDVTRATYDIAGAFEQARAYAMSNNTYVFVGIEEVDATQPAPAVPQAPASATAGGLVVMAVVASKDGTKHYVDASQSQGADWQANYADSSKPEYRGAHLIALGKLIKSGSMHLTASLPIPASGSMYRPSVDSSDQIGNPATVSQTPFTWPLGSALANGYQYRFDKVIQFDPQGSARITTATGGDYVAKWLEASFQQTHGDAVPTPPTGPNGGNQAVIQIDGITGSSHIYRP